MPFISQLIGFVMFIAGVYFLGKNIIFTSGIGRYWYIDISAAFSVLAIIAGVLCLLFIRGLSWLGWFLIVLGIVFVFVSSGVVLKPTSLWTFLLAFVCIASGFKLMTSRQSLF